jgi:hypothetical protein
MKQLILLSIIFFILFGCKKSNDKVDYRYAAVYSPSTITIDGRIEDLEWKNAKVYNIIFKRNDAFDTKEGTLYLQNDGDFLYVGVKTQLDAGWDVYLSMKFDGNNNNVLDGESLEPHTDINIENASPGGWSGYNRYDYLIGNDIYPTTPSNGTLSSSYGNTDVNYEFKIKIADLKINTANVVGFYMFNYNNGIISESYEFPINAIGLDPTKWEEIWLE